MSPRGDRPGRRSGTDGFTLIETLVAFVAFATILSVLFRSVVGLRQDAVAFDTHTHADVVAVALFQEALAKRDLQNGTTSGIRDGRRWTLTASSVDLTPQMPPPPKPAADDPAAQGAAAQGAPRGQPPGAPQDPNAAQKPKWITQRLVLDVATGGGAPVRIETIRLAKVPPQTSDMP